MRESKTYHINEALLELILHQNGLGATSSMAAHVEARFGDSQEVRYMRRLIKNAGAAEPGTAFPVHELDAIVEAAEKELEERA